MQTQHFLQRGQHQTLEQRNYRNKVTGTKHPARLISKKIPEVAEVLQGNTTVESVGQKEGETQKEWLSQEL